VDRPPQRVDVLLLQPEQFARSQPPEAREEHVGASRWDSPSRS
jgi:hypothetical protein